MAHITRDEVRKLAEISQIHVKEEDIDALVKDMEAVIAYASSLQAIAEQSDLSMMRRTPRTTFRDDVVEDWDAEEIVSLAPEEEDGDYVVPKVLKEQ